MSIGGVEDFYPPDATISSELYRRADNELMGNDLKRLMRNGALHIDVMELRLRKALVALRAVRPCVEVYRDRWDFTLGSAMLRDLDETIASLEAHHK